MTLTIKIEMDNAAFGNDDYSRETEIKRILKSVCWQMEGQTAAGSSFSLHDLNGNKCGFYGVDL